MIADSTTAATDRIIQTIATQATGATITDSTSAIPNNKASTFDEPFTNYPDTLISVVTADQGILTIFFVE